MQTTNILAIELVEFFFTMLAVIALAIWLGIREDK